MTDVQYARAGDGTHVAYRVLDTEPDGSSNIDIVMVSGGLIPMEVFEDDPGFLRLLQGLRSLGRLVMFDRRGIGQSDPIVDWDRPVLESLLDAIPQLRANVDSILVQRLNELQDRLLDINTEDVERRVALALLRMLPQVGQKSPSGVEVALSREELAQLSGTNPFALSRIVAKWNAQGMVQANPQAVLILDPRRLFTTGLA